MPARIPPDSVTYADLLTYYGGALKITGDSPDGPLVASGYLVVFSDEASPDLTGDYFTKSTDFGALSDGLPVALPAYYDHGADPTLKTERIGTATLKMDDTGVFAEYAISRRKEYLRRLIEEGHLGQSSGAVAHLVERAEGPAGKAFWLKAWPLGEASLTPTPAEPRTTAVPVKALRHEAGADFDPAAALKAARLASRDADASRLRAARAALSA